MAYKCTVSAGKSARGASMSRYDVEVEARLNKLEEKVSEINTIEAMVSALERSVDQLKSHSHEGSSGGGDCSGVSERLDKVITKLKSAGFAYIDK